MIPSIGRIVHYILPNGQHRPAIIVRVWDEVNPDEYTSVQLQVFTDGLNDVVSLGSAENAGNVIWRTSVMQDSEFKTPGTFHEPERIESAKGDKPLTTPRVGIPRWKCSKIVSAFKIGRIEGHEIFAEDESVSVIASEAYINKHNFNHPGYYVRYVDGYESWSPADVFEAGYTCID